jgi:Family of unknown function (DUF6284)
MTNDFESSGREPSAADLAAIEAEWPLIEAELAVVEAEIRLATASGPSPLSWRRLRRAERQVLAAAVRHGEFGDGRCRICGLAAPQGNLLCGQCEDAEAVLALAVLREAVAS